MFRDALQRITINIDVDEPLMKEWIIRKPTNNGVAWSNIPSSMRSFSVLSSQAKLTNKVKNSDLRKFNGAND